MLDYVFNIVGALPWCFLLSVITFCQCLVPFTDGRGRCCKDISELSPVLATNPHFPWSSLYCWCSGRRSCCLWYPCKWAPAGLWLSQHHPCVPVWYLCVHPFLVPPAILPFCTGAPSCVLCLPNWSPWCLSKNAFCFSEWLRIQVLYFDLLKDLPVLLCCLMLLGVSPMRSHLVPWQLLLSSSWESRLTWTGCLLVSFFLHSPLKLPCLEVITPHWLPQLHLFFFPHKQWSFIFFENMGYYESAGVITVHLMRGSFYAHNGSCYHVPSGSTGKSKHAATVSCYTRLYLSMCSWGPREQKVMFSIAGSHCSLSSLEILLITRGCGVGFDP